MKKRKKDKAFPFRVFFTLIVIVFDICILPQLLSLPFYLRSGNLTDFSLTALGWIPALKETKQVWVWLQPAAVGAVAWIWLTGRSLVNVVYDADVPRPSGHGQHGTARWQTEKEIDKNFKVHHF